MRMDEKSKELYRLTYAIDGMACLVIHVPKGERLENLFRPSKENCTFDGWGEMPTRMPDHDLTLDGHFTRDTSRVIFASGVEQYGIAEKPVGDLLTAPPDPVLEGYDFVRWDGFEGVMPAKSRTFEAIFEPRIYDVTYEVDDTYRFRLQCPYGKAFPQISPPRRQHYEFSGWSETPATMPAHDVVIKGYFTEKKYKLTRVVDEVVFSEEYLSFGEEIDRRVKPVQEGYYFSGWRKLPGTMPAHDLVVIASMYPARYRVDFYLNGELTDSTYVPFGEKIPVEAIEEKPGTLFGGWLDLPATMPAHDIAVHATMTAILYSLSFMVDGEEIDRRDLAEGTRIPADVQVPTKPGYAFCGWEDAPRHMPGHDLTLHAIYAAVQSRYVFILDGVVYAELQPKEGEELVMPTPPPQNGQPFGGWGNVEQDPRTGVITFYGSYHTVTTYTVRYFVNGEEIFSSEKRVGERLTPPQVESCDEYEFIGWKNAPRRMPAHDVAIHADINTLKYVLDFVVGGETLYTMSLEPGQEISCPAVAPRFGYTFAGWQEVPATMPSQNLTIEGTFRLNRHTVTYLLEGETVLAESRAYGEALTPPPVEVEGREFAGWEPQVSEMPNEDIVLHGAFFDKVCLVSIYVDGVLYETKRAAVDSPIDLPKFPHQEGMHFVWQDCPMVAPPGRLSVHGGYVKNLYTVTYLSKECVIGEEHYYYGAALTPHVKLPEAERAKFLGWLDLPETMPSRDLHVRAAFADRVCHVTFRLDGNIISEMDLPVGAPVPTPEVPARDGYRFDGWRNYVDIMPPYNFTAYGAYSRRTYRITYLCGGEKVDEQDYMSGSPIVAPPAPQRKHYTFRSWEGLGTHMPSHDLVVSARYRGETFRISFVVNGVLAHTEEMEFGEKIDPHVPIAPPGQVFSGWHDLPQFMPAKELIVTGTFEPSTHTVTYKVGGMIYRIDTHETGSEIIPPPAPERPHERFVAWRNFTPKMPDYDFVCAAEYEDIVGTYRFVVDGVVLAEGQKRRNETLEPPEPPYRPGFAFSGWGSDYTGKMPTGDVTYVGGYVTDTFKINYYLDGEFYHRDGYHAGERITEPPEPEKDGYAFSGWAHLPDTMPEDDVRVDGHMEPLLFRLRYRTDGKDIIFDEEVPCGTRLFKIEAPDRFGYIFSGWSGEEEFMPPHDVTVGGVYRRVTAELDTFGLPEGTIVDTKAEIEKMHAKAPHAVVFISGDTMRVVVGSYCYPVQAPGIRAYLCNGHVADGEGLSRALRRMWHKYRLPRRVNLVASFGYKTDAFYHAGVDVGVPDDMLMKSLFDEADGFGTAHYTATRLSHTERGTRYLISRFHAPTFEALSRIFADIRVTVVSAETLVGGLVGYLQPNRNMMRGKNQICLYYLPSNVVGVLMEDGQVVCVTRNVYPFEGRTWDIEGMTARVLETLVSEAHRLEVVTPLDMVAVGGCDRTHVRTVEKHVRRLLKDAVEHVIGGIGGNLFGGYRYWHKPNIVTLGYGYVENRTK